MSRAPKFIPQPHKAGNPATQPQAKLQQALALHQQGHLRQAKMIYEQLLKMQPRHFDALHLLGVIAVQTKNPHLGADLIGKAIGLNPNHAGAYNNRGLALNDLKQYQSAIDSYERAIVLKADYAEAYFNCGLALNNLKQHQAAIDSYERAIALKADYAEAYFNRGNALSDLKLNQAAIDSFERAIALKPDYADAYNNHGYALNELKKHQAAVNSYDRAIALKADYAGAYNNRGIALNGLKQHQAAVDSYERAIALKADYAEAYNNRGSALNGLKQHQAAIDSYEHAVSLKADYAEAHLNRSLLELQLGNLQRGWEKFEWRWKCAHRKPEEIRGFTQPLWLGAEPLQGKTILLHAEQGLGDTLQFCRYAKRVSDLGARVILEVQLPLLGLLKGQAGVSELVGRGSKLPPFDVHCPLLSLPLAFKTGLDSIPSSTRYINSLLSKQSSWSARLGPKNRPRIGLVWSGNPGHLNDHNRSIALLELMRGLPSGFQYVSLQKEVRAPDKEYLDEHPDFLHFGNELKDFTDTAALCESMDVVVSVDTSVAHLAGALGQEVWVLLPLNPDWRWLLDRSESPWYPTAKLFRQEAQDDWSSALRRLGADLEKRFGQKLR